MDKSYIINVLNEIGLLLELKGESFFKSKAYYDAAKKLEFIEEDIMTLVTEERLKDLKGFGKALTQKITELVTTGKLGYYENLKEEIPKGLITMLSIQGLGPKKVTMIYNELGIDTIEGLKEACIGNRLIALKGISKKTQDKILKGIEELSNYKGKYLYPVAKSLGDILLEDILESGLVIRAELAGSLRRKKEVVKDIDIIASSDSVGELMNYFTNHKLVKDIIGSGETKSSVTLEYGINCDLRVVSDQSYPYALHHFTGSKEHNTALRHLAKQKGLKINEYGVFKGEELLSCNDEVEFFNLFNMEYIPPELRENTGELEAAENGKLPKLITNEDMQGLIHVHTNFSDGKYSLEEIVLESIKNGFKYLLISDHSKSAVYAGGMNIESVHKQVEEIEYLNKKYSNIRILKGIESDILPDGSLDYPDDILEKFDLVIASVHSKFNMTEEDMTNRILKAVENRHTSILGHPTGRLLLSREAYKLDIDSIIDACIDNNVLLEINASPYRLDLDWRYIKGAKAKGAKFVICPDAHRLTDIENIKFGINVARKGWLSKEDVLNAQDYEMIEAYVK